MTKIEEICRKELSGSFDEALNAEFAIGRYAIEGSKALSHQFVFCLSKGKLYQFTTVTPRFYFYRAWYKTMNFETMPDKDDNGNDIVEWRDRHIRFMKLINKKYPVNSN